MSRSLVLAEQFPHSAVANALWEHRADRDALLASLLAFLQADPRVRAAWLWGSFGRNEADDLSDLDLWIVIAEESSSAFGLSVRRYAEQTGSFISGAEKPHLGPLGGGYFGSLHEGRHGLLHLDCYWQPQSAEVVVPEHAVLLERLAEPALPFPLLSVPHIPNRIQGETEVENGLGFAWLMFSIAAKYLARDPNSDLGLMLYAREGLEKAIALLGQSDALTLDWSVPDVPLAKSERLRRLVSVADQAAEAANAQGLSISLRNAPCLFRYLDMVEAVLTGR